MIFAWKTGYGDFGVPAEIPERDSFLKSDRFDPIYQKDSFCDQPRGAEMSKQRRAQSALLNQ
jgi:hypothetical protein